MSPVVARCLSASCPVGGVCTAPRQPASVAAASSCSQAAAGWKAQPAEPERSRPRGAGSSHSGSAGPWVGSWGVPRSPGRARHLHHCPCTHIKLHLYLRQNNLIYFYFMVDSSSLITLLIIVYNLSSIFFQVNLSHHIIIFSPDVFWQHLACTCLINTLF